MSGALTLFFLASPAGAETATPELDTTIAGYVTRMILALVILGLLGYAAVRFLPGRLTAGARGHIKVVGMLNVGRDMIYIVRTGPEVVAFVSGRTGATVLGRWSLEEWDDYEAAAGARDSLPPE
ncbi:MAG: hypothetical protein FWE55_00875 [Synergistaceae bacterium]|nr:hypothetical protein [Synergistaceae bacterium]